MEMVVVGNVTFTDRPAGRDRSAFVGTLDQVMDDVPTAAEIRERAGVITDSPLPVSRVE